MNNDSKKLLLVYVLAVVGVLSIIAIEEVFADEIQEEAQEVLTFVDEVTLQVTSIEEEVVVVEKKLTHKVSITGNFEGDFDHKLINANGKFRISGDIQTFVLVGTFENEGVRYWNPYTGEYQTSNPNCQIVVGDLVLRSPDTRVELIFNGQTCTYGLMSYVIGTFVTGDSSGSYAGVEGEGRITFVADHHNNNVSGQLKGSFE